MRVREAMSGNCKSVKINESLKAAAAHMRESDVGMLLVEDEHGEVCGVLTDRDITVRGVARGLRGEHTLESCISRNPLSCHEDDDLLEAAHLMEQEQVRRLLVRDATDRPVGVLAQADLARAMGRSELFGEFLQEVSQPGGDHSQQ